MNKYIKPMLIMCLSVLSIFIVEKAIAQSGNHVFEPSETVNFGIIDLSTPGGQTWSTDRTATPGYFCAVGGATYTGATDANANVDGYVKYYASTSPATSFTFPVGTGSDLRTLTISGAILNNAAYGVAWILGDPTGSLDPTVPNAGAHNVASNAYDIMAVSSVGQWDWQDINGDAAGLTVTVSIPDMTAFATAEELRLVGWNGTEWVNLSVSQGTSAASGNTEDNTLEGTMIAGITAIGIGRAALETEPDINAGFVGIDIDGNVNTNDNVPAGTTYSNPVANAGNPSSTLPTVNPDGTYTFNTDTPGVYVFEITVCPPGMSTGCPTETLTITVEEPSTINPPIANTDVATTAMNTPADINVLSNDQPGMNGAPLDVTSVTQVTAPSNGSITINPTTGEVTYTPTTGFVGVDSFEYSVCDTNGLCATAWSYVTVMPPNAPNTTDAADDYATTGYNTAVSGNALLNDTDPEGDGQIVTADSQYVSGVGTFVIDSLGNYTFSPDSTFSGSTNFEYTVCDDGTPQACDQATIYITVEPPLFVTEPDINAGFVGIDIDGNVNTNDNVPAGTTYSNPVANAGNPSSTLPTVNPDGTYTFNTDTPGVYVFEITVCPPGMSTGCPTETLTITVEEPSTINPPIANTDVATTAMNTPADINVLSNDQPGMNGAPLDVTSVTQVTAPSNGSITINPTTGEVTYTPTTGFVGVDSFEYSVCDTNGLCATAWSYVTVMPPNAPNTTDAADDYATTGYNTAVSGNALLNDTDPEGDGQIVTADSQYVSGVGTFVIDSLGNYTFTSDSTFSGSTNFVYTVCDDGTPQACDQATIYITVEPGVPDLTPTLDIDELNFVATGSNRDFLVNIYNIGNGATDGMTPIIFRIYKISGFNITYMSTSGTSGVFGGVANNNSDWTITENALYITITAKPYVVIPSGGYSVVGFHIERKDSVAPNTSQLVTPTIIPGAGGENKIDNNAVTRLMTAN